MSNEMMKREMQEAVQAGERALQSLYAARDKLGSARNWGIFDMLGGGFISDFVKHSKMNDAAALMEQAKSDIQRFQRELRDVQVSLDLRMEIGSFLSFADFFLDGLVADYMVQSKIADAREQVDDAINRIEKILADVKNRMPEEAERGIMHWYHKPDSINTKVHSAVFMVDSRGGELWGIAECRVAGELSDTEMDTLKEFITGQASDGWCEGFEQREISVDDGGELYVHFWNSDEWSIQTEQELFAPKLREQNGMKMGGMTLG